jgi:transcriptional regulator with XRE-family HTH domain
LIVALDARRARLRRSQAAQARALGISETYYSLLLRGDKQPSMGVLIRAVREHRPLARLAGRQVLFQAGLDRGPYALGEAA